MLGLDNPIHLAFVLVLLLLVFGAKRLPEMGKSLGSGLRGFKESLTADEPLHELHSDHAPQRGDELTDEPVIETPSDQRTPVRPAA
jgi:sec-independent protein translocase protein TatA